MAFRPGEFVQLKTGGPILIVSSLTEAGHCNVIGFDNTNRPFSLTNMLSETLKKVKPNGSKKASNN